jgi:hypothetical protein
LHPGQDFVFLNVFKLFLGEIMLRKTFLIVSVLFLASALSHGCSCIADPTSDPPPVEHPTKLYVQFGGNPSGSKPDPLPNEIVDVTVDGTLEGTADANDIFYETIDSGTHIITTKSRLVNSSYTITHHIATGEQFTDYFNCGDAHITFIADAAWALENVTTLTVIYKNVNPPPVTSSYNVKLVPGEQAAPVDVQAGSSIVVYDQNNKLLKTIVAGVPYDATTSITISP